MTLNELVEQLNNPPVRRYLWDGDRWALRRDLRQRYYLIPGRTLEPPKPDLSQFRIPPLLADYTIKTVDPRYYGTVTIANL